MTIHTWDGKGMFDKRQAQLWSLVPSSVDPKDLDDLVRYMQLNNTSFLVRSTHDHTWIVVDAYDTG
jgi:hypothetical protein